MQPHPTSEMQWCNSLWLHDGSTDAIMMNLIAENLYSQVDAEGHTFSVIKEIIDHCKDGHARLNDDGYLVTKSGQQKLKCTTQGWDHLCELGDGMTTWIPLKDLKESMPVQVVEYAIANRIAKEPAYAWWVCDVLRWCDCIISKVTSQYWKWTHKYGIKLPKMVKQAYKINEEMGTTFWHDAIEKEMKNVMPMFEFSDTDKIPKFHKLISCHMIFDIKLRNLACKAWYMWLVDTRWILSRIPPTWVSSQGTALGLHSLLPPWMILTHLQLMFRMPTWMCQLARRSIP